MTARAPDSALLTLTGYAEHRGISRQRVGQLVANQRIPIVFLVPGDDRSRRINPAVADAALADTRDPEQKAKGAAGAAICAPPKVDDPRPGIPVAPIAPNQPHASATRARASGTVADAGKPGAAVPHGMPGIEGSFAAARTDTEKLRARRLEVDLRERVGELVEKDRYDAAVFDACTAIAKILDTIPDRLCGPLAAESDPRKCRAMLQAEIVAVRTEVADAAAKLTAPVGERIKTAA